MKRYLFALFLTFFAFTSGPDSAAGPIFGCNCYEDLDCDDVIGMSDLLILLNNWGWCHCYVPGDLNADYVVDCLDVVLLLNAWGPCKELP